MKAWYCKVNETPGKEEKRRARGLYKEAWELLEYYAQYLNEDTVSGKELVEVMSKILEGCRARVKAKQVEIRKELVNGSSDKAD